VRRLAAIVAFIAVAPGCPQTSSAPDDDDDLGDDDLGDDDSGDDDDACEGSALPIVLTADPERAARGEALLREGFGDGLVPRLALDNLWVAWGTAPVAGEAYRAAVRERYGLAEAPWDNDGYPLGIHAVDGTMATIDCLLCHSDVVAGEVVVGAGNSRVDFQGLHDDLVLMNERAPDFGLPSLTLPWTMEGRTGAAGATDAFGFAMQLSEPYGPAGVEPATEYGFQQAPAWWNLKHKTRLYTDGSGLASAHRTMAATTLAFGWTFAELEALDEDLLDLHHHLRTLQAPAWPFDAPDPAAVDRGRSVFAADCAGCHGRHCDLDEPGFPDLVPRVGLVGTDPVRTDRFTDLEAAWVNGSWFGGSGPVSATDGYLAGPLVGVWATAPYLHNGSVPTLRALLDSSLRPARWRIAGTGAADYDPVDVGRRYTEPAPPPDRDSIESRRVYDTTIPGLSAAGHVFGDTLGGADRDDLIEYLKTL